MLLISSFLYQGSRVRPKSGVTRSVDNCTSTTIDDSSFKNSNVRLIVWSARVALYVPHTCPRWRCGTSGSVVWRLAGNERGKGPLLGANLKERFIVHECKAFSTEMKLGSDNMCLCTHRKLCASGSSKTDVCCLCFLEVVAWDGHTCMYTRIEVANSGWLFWWQLTASLLEN